MNAWGPLVYALRPDATRSTDAVTLALFDLDNTLIGGDSDHLWGQHLCALGVVEADWFAREHERFYAEYLAGTLDIDEFLAFQLAPLSRHEPAELEAWREAFMEQMIRPVLLEKAHELVADHRRRGHMPVIITATNRFVTAPIAEALGVEHLIATEPEVDGTRFTGRVAGTPCFREGKVTRLLEWLAAREETLDGSWFYSDSRNDLPLLERVHHPVAVDPDPALRQVAEARGWPVISLR